MGQHGAAGERRARAWIRHTMIFAPGRDLCNVSLDGVEDARRASLDQNGQTRYT